MGVELGGEVEDHLRRPQYTRIRTMAQTTRTPAQTIKKPGYHSG